VGALKFEVEWMKNGEFTLIAHERMGKVARVDEWTGHLM
jgi:hypothetical protein